MDAVRLAELRVGDRVGHYRIVELLGRGAVGCVYRAVDEQLNREVALKLLAPDVDVGDDSQLRSDAARRMVREARAAAAFAHPNAVALYDVGVVDNSPYIAMELVHGKTLRARIGETGVPLGEKLRWMSDVGRALAAAHKAGLVHRDVKPDNVIVGDDGVVKLLDFGVARRVPRADPSGPSHHHQGSTEGTITIDGALVGTPAYMSPEQLRGERVDGRADQFSWAVTAYELIAGKKPWSAASAPMLIAAIIGREPEWLTAEGVPRHVAATVMRALSKSAEQRFRTMDALLEALAGRARVQPRWPGLGRKLKVPALIVGLFALAALGAWWLARPRGGETGTGQTGAGARVAPAPASLRFPCPPAPRRDEGLPACADGRAWCDGTGHQVACCPEGLVATGREAACACPPGGIADRAGCAAPVRTAAEYAGVYMPAAVRKVMGECGVAAGAEPLALEVWVDPEGRVFDVRIVEAYTADARVQRCVVEGVKGAGLEAPPGGVAQVRVGRR